MTDNKRSAEDDESPGTWKKHKTSNVFDINVRYIKKSAARTDRLIDLVEELRERLIFQAATIRTMPVPYDELLHDFNQLHKSSVARVRSDVHEADDSVEDMEQIIEQANDGTGLRTTFEISEDEDNTDDDESHETTDDEGISGDEETTEDEEMSVLSDSEEESTMSSEDDEME